MNPQEERRRKSPTRIYEGVRRAEDREEESRRTRTPPEAPVAAPKRPADADLREAYRRLGHLYEISKLLARFESPEESVLGVLAIATKTLSLRSGVLVEMPPHPERVIVWHARELSPAEVEEAKAHAISASAYLAGPAPPLMAPDVVEAGTRLLPGPSGAGAGQKVEGPGRFIVLPLVVDRPPAFGAFQVEGAGPFTEADLGFVNAVATQLAVALDRYYTRERVREAGRRLELLAEVGRLTAAPLDTEATLARAAEVVVREMADFCVIHLPGEGHAARRAFARSRKLPRDAPEEEKRSRLLEDATARVIATGRPVAEFVRPVAGRKDEASGPSFLASLVSAPILVRGQTLGAVTLARTDPEEPYDEGNLKMAEDIAYRIALAVSRNLAEDKVSEMNATLERRILERTAKLQEVVIELNAFAYTVAHDLRAPLRAMQGFSQALIEDYGSRLEETGRNFLRRISAASVRMDALIQDLLAYAHLTQEDVELEPVDLGSLVRKVLGEMAGELKERKAEVTVEEPIPRCLGYRRALAQALTNLISNAAKFVSRGVEPRIRIRAELRNSWCRLWVEDNGIGIAPEYHEKIFGLFQRLHKREEYPGTGSGLAIVRKAMERMGGRAGVKSEPGKGSRFFIELPGVRSDP
jgi:signal transduction histidine kinase